MSQQTYNLDMTMMFAIHDALRRDLQQGAQAAAPSEGWGLFERMLHEHHTAEDDLVWPVVRGAVGASTDELALLDDMASEHAALGPLLDAIDAAHSRGESAPEAGANLATRVKEHLTHEEEAALPLIDRTLTEEQWMTVAQGSAERVGPDMPSFLAWVLDGADGDVAARVLGRMPDPVQQDYRPTPRSTGGRRRSWSTSRLVDRRMAAGDRSVSPRRRRR